MAKRLLSPLSMLILLVILLTGCTSKENDFGVAGTLGTVEQEETDGKNVSDNRNKNESDSNKTNQNKEGSSKDNNTAQGNQTPSSDNGSSNTPSKDQTPSDTPNDSKDADSAPVIATLTNLQKAGSAFTVKAGETIWFGPMAINQTIPLTVDGKTIGISSLTEVAKFGGGYRLYSYKVTADGSVTVSAPQGYENKFLISLGQKMTEKEYYHHIDKDSVQLYDAALDSTGKTVAWNGKESSSSDYHLAHAVYLQQGNTLTFGPCSSAQVVQGYAYDANGNAVALINASVLKEEGILGSSYKIYTYTVPAEIASVRILVSDQLKGKFVMMKNKVFNDKDYFNLSGVSSSTLADSLKGKTALFVGDSVCEGWKNGNTGVARFPDAYAGLIAKETGLVSTNAGVGSSTISDEKPVYNQFEALKNKNYDYVVIQGGINDMSHNRKIGSVSDSFDPETWDLSTYAGGLEYTIYKAIRYYGDTAAIGCLFSYQSPNHPSGNGAKLPEYVAVGKQICEKWGISYLDMCNHAEITQKLNFTEKVNTSDFIHLNTTGYEIVVPYIIEFMRGMTPCSSELLNTILE